MELDGTVTVSSSIDVDENVYTLKKKKKPKPGQITMVTDTSDFKLNKDKNSKYFQKQL